MRRDLRDERVGGVALVVRELDLLEVSRTGRPRRSSVGARPAVAVRQLLSRSRSPMAALPPTRASSADPVDPVVDDVPQAGQDCRRAPALWRSPVRPRPCRTSASHGPPATASTEPSGSGICSALPSRARTVGSAPRSSASIAGSGSTATTSAPTSSQGGSELAGARAEVEDALAARGVAGPSDRGLGVVGAVPCVGRRGSAERGGERSGFAAHVGEYPHGSQVNGCAGSQRSEPSRGEQGGPVDRVHFLPRRSR